MCKKMIKKKVAVVIASRANYGRCKTLLASIKEHKSLELILIVCGSALLDKFGKTSNIIKQDGFKINFECNYLLAGSDLRSQATTTGLAIIQLTDIFNICCPDFVVTIADRYETLATAISASYQNIPLIHLQGGDISGNIDDKVRNAITRLSEYHFPASNKSYSNLVNMGIAEDSIWMHGCPSMDLINEITSFKEFIKSSENLKSLDQKKYYLILLHPVTDKPKESILIFKNLIKALNNFKSSKFVIISPNVDAGSEEIRNFHRLAMDNRKDNLLFVENISPNNFLNLISNAQICIGNSSSFLREAALCGVPSLILGTRQEGREMGNNCLVLKSPKEKDIIDKINFLLKVKKFNPDMRFGDGNSGRKIADTIARISKKFE